MSGGIGGAGGVGGVSGSQAKQIGNFAINQAEGFDARSEAGGPATIGPDGPIERLDPSMGFGPPGMVPLPTTEKEFDVEDIEIPDFQQPQERPAVPWQPNAMASMASQEGGPWEDTVMPTGDEWRTFYA